MADEKAIETFLQKANEKKFGGKKSMKQVLSDYRKWKDGKLDKETTLPKRPTKGRMANAKIKPTT